MRMVFPVFRRDGKIHGFAGRTVQKNGNPKWIFKGKTRDWVYPMWLKSGNNLPIFESVNKTKEAFVIESVGDSMAMFQNGYPNNAVAFGVSCSSKVIAFLAGIGVSRINICFNDDSDKEDNTGKRKAAELFVSLLNLWSPESIRILLPCGNDFCSLDHDWAEFRRKCKSITWKDNKSEILRAIEENKMNFPDKKLKIIKEKIR
jgi:DNA primase